jgi:hypothetical protein
MVEQWTHKPLVVGSSPTLATQKQPDAGLFYYTRKNTPQTIASKITV